MINSSYIVWAGLGGAFGAVCRFVLDGTVKELTARRRLFVAALPAGTMLINVVGSFILGLLNGLVLYQSAPTLLAVIAGTGFCGGFTTFSTASFETVRLLQEGDNRLALVNGLGTLLLTLAAAALGLLIGYA